MPTEMIVCGATGRMGRALVRLVQEHPDAILAGAVEAPGNPAVGRDAGEVAGVGTLGVPIVDDFARIAKPSAVALDFTAHSSAIVHLRVAVDARSPIVIGTTGFTDAEQAELDRLAPQTRCVIAPNMSVGVNALLRLVAAAARALGDGFDPEIVEMHHRMKVDAPSGTALALARAVADALGRDLKTAGRYGREGLIGKRTDSEIGVMSLRGGDVVGEHTVVFAGTGERIEMTHRAHNRDCFAGGAIRAGLWLEHQPPGRYSMSDVLGL